MSGSNVPKAAELAAGFGTDALRWAAALHSCSCIIRFLPATSCASQTFRATGALRNSRQGESAPSRNERRCQPGFPRSRYGCGTLYIQASPVPTFFVLHDICCQLSHGRPCPRGRANQELCEPPSNHRRRVGESTFHVQLLIFETAQRWCLRTSNHWDSRLDRLL